MKKFIAFIFSISCAASVVALPVGNPSDASLLTNGVFCESYELDCCDPCFSWCDAWSLRLGFYGDYVFDRHLKTDPSGYSDSTLRRTEIYTNAGYIALNICDRFDIFTTLGASHFRIHGQESNFETVDLSTDNALVFETDTAFSWSIGARATIWECGCFAFGGEFQYFQTCPNLNYLLVYNEPTDYFVDEDFNYCEWQVGLGVSYRMNISCSTAIVPYLAVKGGGTHVDMNNAVIDTRKVMHDLENDRCFGYAVGMTLVGCSFWSATLEGRFIDELALSFNTQFRY